MAELARGTIFDRPWGRTLWALGTRNLTGQLTLYGEGKHYAIAFWNGAVVAAASPLASDSAIRVALTSGLISASQVADLTRKQSAAPGRDEVELIAEHVKLGYEHAMRLRRRTIAQRAARSFSVDKGEFIVTDETTLSGVAGSELDVRAVIFLGAKQNLSEARLAAELGLFGAWFRLKPESFEDLPQFGFTEAERPIIDALMNGASLGELEAIVGIDPRAVRAALYALAAANACNAEQTRGQGTTKQPPAAMKSDPGIKRGAGSDPGIKRTGTGSQPPASQPAAAPARAHRPSQQPVVAYRPGTRRPPSSPPPNVTQTPVDIEMNRPVGSTGNTMPPANARRAQTAPPAAEGTQPRTGSGSDPGFARTRTTTPMPDPRTRTTTPVPDMARSRPVTPIPTVNVTPRISGQTLPPEALVSRAPTPKRASTPPPVTDTSPPPVSRTTTPLPTNRTGSQTKLPTMAAPEVISLIEERAVQIDQDADHYILLGLQPTATADEIRKVYFNLARQLHPDRLAALGIADEAKDAHRVFAQLNTAFSILSDPKRRAEYDQLLNRGGEGVAREEQAKAEEMATKIVAAEEAYKRGELALKRDDFGTAIMELTKATELNPEEADFAALHAWALFCATPDKNVVAKQTREKLERAIQKSPKSINPRFLLGRVERMLGRDNVALDLFKDVLLDKPHHFEAQSEIRAIETRLQQGGPKGGGGLFGRKR